MKDTNNHRKLKETQQQGIHVYVRKIVLSMIGLRFKRKCTFCTFTVDTKLLIITKG